MSQLRARLAESDKQLADARTQLAREQQSVAQQTARVATLEQQLAHLQQTKVCCGVVFLSGLGCCWAVLWQELVARALTGCNGLWTMFSYSSRCIFCYIR